MTTPILPLHGTPDVLSQTNPTLVPDTDTPVAVGANTTLLSPQDFAAAYPRAAASATATLGGSATSGDTVTITATNPIFANPALGGAANGAVAIGYTAVGGDTLATIAEALAQLFNADAGLKAAGFSASVHGAVITFDHDGPVGNFTVLTKTLSGGATETVTFAPVSGRLTGGDGPVYAFNNFQYAQGGQMLNFRYGQPMFVDTPLLTALVNDAEPIV